MEPKADNDSNTSQQAPDSDSHHYHQSSSTEQSSKNKPTLTEAARKEKVARDKMKRAQLSELFKKLGQRVGMDETQTGKKNDRTNIIILKKTLKLLEEQAGPSRVIESNNQYRTQHRLDGVIIGVDAERIQMIAGYSKEEVLMTQAYKYINSEHVPYVDIDLRKMLVSHRGTTVYQLQKKNGDWIFLRTEGAVDPTTLSFECTNMTLTEEEGRREIDAIRQKYSAWIVDKNDTPTNYTHPQQPSTPTAMDTTGDDATSSQEHYLLTTEQGEPIYCVSS